MQGQPAIRYDYTHVEQCNLYRIISYTFVLRLDDSILGSIYTVRIWTMTILCSIDTLLPTILL
jgi:hypothetical protein